MTSLSPWTDPRCRLGVKRQVIYSVQFSSSAKSDQRRPNWWGPYGLWMPRGVFRDLSRSHYRATETNPWWKRWGRPPYGDRSGRKHCEFPSPPSTSSGWLKNPLSWLLELWRTINEGKIDSSDSHALHTSIAGWWQDAGNWKVSKDHSEVPKALVSQVSTALCDQFPVTVQASSCNADWCRFPRIEPTENNMAPKYVFVYHNSDYDFTCFSMTFLLIVYFLCADTLEHKLSNLPQMSLISCK